MRLLTGKWGLTFLLAGAAGIAIRVWTLRSDLDIPNSDEASGGLMVRHALHGEFSTFVWGRAYGGTQEFLLAAPGFAIFGSGYLAMRMVPIILSAVGCYFIWRIGRRTIGEPAAGVAAALFWVWPTFNFLQLTRAQGFYASNVAYCGALILLGLQLVERPDDRKRIALFGLVLGLGYWQTAQISPVAFALVAWMIYRRRTLLRQAWIAAIGAIVGASPWIIWNIGHGFASLQQNPGLHTYLRSLRLLVSPLAAMTIGLRAPYSSELLIPSHIITWAIYVLLVGLFLYGAVKMRHENVAVLYAILAVFPFLYALPRKTSFISAYPQYTVVITPILALLFAQLATRYWRTVVILALAAVVSAINLNRMNVFFVNTPQPLPNAPRSFSPLIAELNTLGLNRVYADYWISFRLTFDAKERIIAVENSFAEAKTRKGAVIPNADPKEIRYWPYQRKVSEAPRPGFVFWRQTFRTLPILPQLERAGYRRVDVGAWVIYAPPV